MRALFPSALATCLLLSAPFAFGQVPAPPPPPPGPIRTLQGAGLPGMPPTRDNAAATSPAGTGRIRGRVLAAETGSPLRLAQVRLNVADPRVNRFANTDTEGRYEFTELPAARYSVNASKAGYVMLQFGQQRAFEPGRPLELADGQIADNIDFSLPRGSVITGRITDEYGEPIAQAQVFAMRYQYMPGGQRRLTPTSMPDMTDDLGQYRIFGLSPGEYLVSAMMRSFAMVNAGPAPPGDVSDPSGYPTTYFPGTTSPANAQAVILGLGQEAAAYFSLASARLARVTGRVIDSQGQPIIGAMLQLRSSDGNMTMYLGGSMSQPDGGFALVNVQPGEYSIEVRPQSRTINPNEAESASVPLTVANENITGLLITTGRGTTVSGRIIFDSKSAPPRGQNPLSIVASPADPQMGPPMFFMDANGIVGEDGRFQLRGVNGKMLLRPTGIPPNWTLKSVTLDGQDITDTTYEFKSSGHVAGVEVVISDRSTSLSGTVRDSRGQQVKDYVVALFPRELKEGMDQRRFVRTTRPDQEGRYQTRGLPPGDYLAAAVESLEQGREWDPSFQEQIRPRAKSFSLKEGESMTLDLPLETAP